MQVTDHAPFQSLNPIKPLEYVQLLSRVYRAWGQAKNGKLKAKDL